MRLCGLEEGAHATVRIEGERDVLPLGAGDSLLLPAPARHRVEWADPTADTVWLALHYQATASRA
jgi:cupin 2 domain-containing protein